MYIDHIGELLAQHVPCDKEEIKALIVKSDNKEHGDFAFPCFPLAKKLRKAPAAIAAELAEKIELPDCFSKCENVGPYLNFFVDQAHFNGYVIGEISEKKDRYGSSGIGVGKACLLEHTSINPNASPHIGRARNAIVGDFVGRLLKFEGYDVKVHYFVNDIGKQISMLVLGAGEREEVKFDDLLNLYVDINNRVKEDPELEKQVFDLLYQLENGDEAVRKRFRQIVDVCIKGQSAIFNELGIFYDCCDYESQFLFDNSLEDIIRQLLDKGLVFEDDLGRYVVNLEKYGLSPLVITRADKTSLYPLRDIAYTIWKCSHNTDKNIIILGQDQELYFKQIAAIVTELGHRPPEVVHYSFVMLVDGKMSTRQGTVVLLEDFMREAVNKADEGIVERGDQSDPERAKRIAYGAVKYSMEKTSNERNVIFDWDKALSFDGDTGPYILYSYVRINSILKKCGADSADLTGAVDYSLLNREAESDLITQLYAFPDVVQKAVREFSPHVITHYIFDLAKKFSAFYRECQVMNAEDVQLKNARIRLILSVRQVLENAFGIIGMETVEHM